MIIKDIKFDSPHMEVICNECNINKFTVIRPSFEVPKDDGYFTCAQCVRNLNRKRYMNVIIDG